MIPNNVAGFEGEVSVVNCFQNCIFTYDSQHVLVRGTDGIGCELLSELYFYL